MSTSSPEQSPEALEQLKKNLVYGYRILARYGIGLGLLAHLTARLPGAQTFWSYKWGDSFEDVTVEGLRECDFQGNVLSGDGTVNASLKIEGMLYAARPDINAITHHHADNCLALGAIGQVLQPFERSAARLYEDMVLLQDYDNAHIDPVMAKAFVDALGSTQCGHDATPRHHGLRTQCSRGGGGDQRSRNFSRRSTQSHGGWSASSLASRRSDSRQRAQKNRTFLHGCLEL